MIKYLIILMLIIPISFSKDLSKKPDKYVKKYLINKSHKVNLANILLHYTTKNNASMVSFILNNFTNREIYSKSISDLDTIILISLRKDNKEIFNLLYNSKETCNRLNDSLIISKKLNRLYAIKLLQEHQDNQESKCITIYS